jgi:2,3-bisphosphoglycerate-dependent phosphoglycerate mutase
MARVFIFRHGQTTDNIEHDFSGIHDVDLTPDGIKEAEEIAEKLKDERVSTAYQSDQIRSKHTLQIILMPHPGIEPITDPRIKERDYGDLTGKNKDELEKIDPNDFKLWHRSYDVAPPNGESIKDVEVRVLEFLNEVVPSWKPNDIIFISAHGNSIRPMRRYFEHISIDQMCSYENIPGKIYEYTI